MTGSNGIDVSNNNGRLVLTRGFSGLDFVIAKASEGTGFIDPDYAWYEGQAHVAGVLFGAYHFGHPELQDGRREAELFMSVAPPRSGWSLWYDYEQAQDGTWRGMTPAADAEALTAFIDTIKIAYPHARIGLYSNLTGMARILPHDVPWDAIWFADPTGQLETPDAPLAHLGASWNIHQYETFAGIDRNYSRWTRQQMQEFFTWPA